MLARAQDGPLTRIEQVAALPLQTDKHPPVHLTGWVAFPDPTLNVLFVEDGAGGARVDLPFAYCGGQSGDRVWKQTGKPARRFRDFRYRTRESWKRGRRVVGKAEYLDQGENPRFVVTSLSVEQMEPHAL